jgi:4-amino-4-deoxy-L-arabinose transferase-like glycosyltransferase
MPIGSRLRGLLMPFQRLADALCDPVRRDRAALGLIVFYVAAWTLYGVLAKGSQGIHFDMAELADLSQHTVLGNAKNPPFAMWVTAAWFAIFPRADWAFYLLAMSGVGVALWAAWRLFGMWLDGEKRVLALLVLTFLPLLTFHALKFNNNALMIPLWALTTLWFVRSYETRRSIDAALAGLAAAACMLTKYWSVFLMAGLALAALSDRRRESYFRSKAPWITACVGVLALAPHLAWLVSNRFPSFAYALAVHGGRTVGGAIKASIGYLGGIAAYGAIPAAITLAAARPPGAVLADMLLPSDERVRFAAVAFWTSLLLPVAVALGMGTEIVALWTMPAWTLLPVLLLWSPKLTVTREALVRVLALAILFPVGAVLAAPFIALAIHRAPEPGAGAYYQPVAQATQQAWRAITGAPLRYIGGEGDLAYGVAFYLPDRPTAFPDLNRFMAPWVEPSEVTRDGIALVCPMEAEGCVEKMRGYAANASRFSIDEVALSNRYLGRDGAPKRFLIIVVAPQNLLAQAEKSPLP